MGNQKQDLDWTGVKPDDSPIEPLTAETFVSRLNRLSVQVNALRRLQDAFNNRGDRDGGQLPRDSSEATK